MSAARRIGAALLAVAFAGAPGAAPAQSGADYFSVVDTDGNGRVSLPEFLERMSWAFRQMDAFEFISTTEVTYDVVTADPFTGETMERCHRDLLSFCRLARHAVVMGSTAAQPIHRAPEGWRITDTVHRSDFGGGVFWTVLRPE